MNIKQDFSNWRNWRIHSTCKIRWKWENVVRSALSDSELIDFPGIGTLEAFNSDGLRTLAFTLSAPNMKEKTLRYPGHIDKMFLLRESGFFSKDEIEVNGMKIKPIDFTSKLYSLCGN